MALKSAFHDLREGAVAVESLDAVPYAERAWAAELASTDVPVNWGRSDEKSARAMVLALVKRFLERDDLAEYVRSIVALDVSFEYPVVHPDTGQDTGVSLRGILDLVIRDDQGRPQVLDLKTSASRSGWAPSALRHHLQGSVYGWALPQLYPDEPVSDEVVFDVGFKLKEPVWERRSVVLEEDAQRRAVKTVLAAHRGMELGVVMPTPGWGCPTCPYAQRCERFGEEPLPVPMHDVFADEIMVGDTPAA